MRQFFLISGLGLLLLQACSNHPTGAYVCDKSNELKDTVIKHDGYQEAFIDFSCAIQQFNFKGNSSVLVRVNGFDVATNYTVDKDYISIKGSNAEFLLKIMDDSTLILEGALPGTYRRNGKESFLRMTPEAPFYIGGALLLTLMILLYIRHRRRNFKATQNLKKELTASIKEELKDGDHYIA